MAAICGCANHGRRTDADSCLTRIALGARIVVVARKVIHLGIHHALPGLRVTIRNVALVGCFADHAKAHIDWLTRARAAGESDCTRNARIAGRIRRQEPFTRTCGVIRRHIVAAVQCMGSKARIRAYVDQRKGVFGRAGCMTDLYFAVGGKVVALTGRQRCRGLFGGGVIRLRRHAA